MMLLTKECDYGLRIMRTLADGKMKRVIDICDEEFVPHKYAYKILKKLQKSGFVQNRLGPKGGYMLVKPLNTFTLYDVVIAVDDKLFLFECLREDKNCPRNTTGNICMVHLEFIRLQDILVAEMKAKNMEEVMFGC